MHIVVKIPSLCKFLKKTWLYCVMPGSLPEPRKGSCKQVLWGVRKSLGNWTADISSKEDEGRDRGKERTFYFSLLFLPYILKGQCTWLFFWKNSTKPIWWGGGLFVCLFCRLSGIWRWQYHLGGSTPWPEPTTEIEWHRPGWTSSKASHSRGIWV